MGKNMLAFDCSAHHAHHTPLQSYKDESATLNFNAEHTGEHVSVSGKNPSDNRSGQCGLRVEVLAATDLARPAYRAGDFFKRAIHGASSGLGHIYVTISCGVQTSRTREVTAKLSRAARFEGQVFFLQAKDELANLENVADSQSFRFAVDDRVRCREDGREGTVVHVYDDGNPKVRIDGEE